MRLPGHPVVKALLQSAVTAVFVGSIVTTLGTVAGLTYLSRMWLGMRGDG